MTPLWTLVGLRWLLVGVLCLTGITAPIALSLSFAGERQRRIARVLWPLAGIALWMSACLFMAAIFTNWPGPPHSLPVSRLALPVFLIILGAVLWGYWIRWAVRGVRAENPHAKIAA